MIFFTDTWLAGLDRTARDMHYWLHLESLRERLPSTVLGLLDQWELSPSRLRGIRVRDNAWDFCRRMRHPSCPTWLPKGRPSSFVLETEATRRADDERPPHGSLVLVYGNIRRFRYGKQDDWFFDHPPEIMAVQCDEWDLLPDGCLVHRLLLTHPHWAERRRALLRGKPSLLSAAYAVELEIHFRDFTVTEHSDPGPRKEWVPWDPDIWKPLPRTGKTEEKTNVEPVTCVDRSARVQRGYFKFLPFIFDSGGRLDFGNESRVRNFGNLMKQVLKEEVPLHEVEEEISVFLQLRGYSETFIDLQVRTFRDFTKGSVCKDPL
ncbi:MAG: hypothetical protein HC904_04835 [Blastochloris sp.]|nr:hypothetical protein [Blastochloris sp.]